MKAGIIGLPQSGKTTIFEALTGNFSAPSHKGEARLGMVRVPDKRVDVLSDMFIPPKTIYAQVEYYLPARHGDKEESLWNQIRDCDSLIHVVRNFSGYGLLPPKPSTDFNNLDTELTFADLVVAEKRAERIKQERQRGKKINPEELALIAECQKLLESETPLRKHPALAGAHLQKGFAFLSAKPQLVLFNNLDEDESLPEAGELLQSESCSVIRGRLEHELAQMTEEEAREFLSEFNISASAMDRVIKMSYELLGLISFFTIGSDEVKAWTIPRGTSALEAADVIHSDMKKGFIRAEVVAFDDLIAAGGFPEAKKRGTLRLEGKTYEVQDGDIITVRFNV